MIRSADTAGSAGRTAAVRSLSLEQKVRLLSGAAQFALAGEPSIGLEPIILSDGPTGVRGDVVVGGRQSCLLPNASLLAQTWDEAALTEVGDILAEEAIDQRTHVVLGPTINLHRSPLGGRLFEAFSEDPLLTARLASSYVAGLQQRGIGASLKHFLGNESETERTTVDVRMDEETMREVYLAPFEMVLADANPWTLMASYNLVNGTSATEHHELLQTIAKDQWGYDGVVVSDWFAVSRTVESVTAGLDLVMPGPDTPWSRELVERVHDGVVAEAHLDDHLERLLLLAERTGALGAPRAWSEQVPAPTSAQRREQLTRLAASGMVVLRNEDQVLPLPVDGEGAIALIGRHATDTIVQGGGSARVREPYAVSIADGLAETLGEDRLLVVDGVETRQTLPVAPPELVSHPLTGEQGIRVRALDADGEVLHDGRLEVAELEDSRTGWLEHAYTIELSAAIQVPEPRDVQLGVRGPGEWSISAPSLEETVTIPFHDGPGGGFFRPRSHARTVRVSPGDVLTARTTRTSLARILGLVVSPARRASASVLTEATTAAARAELAVVVVGLTPDQETEGQDKTTLRLPGDQDALVAAVAATAKRTVVVVNAATPVLMPWEDQVDAILIAGMPGQEAGRAVAAALTGEVLPEGRLVTTYPRHDGQGPAWSTTPSDGVLTYAEGRHVGYRGWIRDEERPAHWFGEGLGYARWSWRDPRVTGRDELSRPQSVEVTVENTGAHSGIETVQVYVEPADPQLPTRLVGWARVEVAPGETVTAEVMCEPRMLRSWNRDEQAWDPLVEGRVLVGRHSGDLRPVL